MTIRAQSPIDESTEPDELLSLLSRADPHWLNKWARSPDRYLCRDCRREVQAIGEYCMLKEQIWYRTGLGSIGGVLCLRCIEHRLGRLLRRRDFEIATTREPLRDFGHGPMVPIAWLKHLKERRRA